MNRQIIANVINTGRLVGSNLNDDPIYFVLQVARKFKTAPGIDALRATLNSDLSPTLAKAFGAMIGDDIAGLERACRPWANSKQQRRGSVFLANLCTSSGQWDLARDLLSNARPSPGKVRAEARLSWSLGKMSDAVRILSQLESSRQKRHYESELSVFGGAQISVNSALSSRYKVRDARSVLFLATNSLPHTGSGYAQRTQSVLSSLHEIGWKVYAATRVQYPLNIGKLNSSVEDKVGNIVYERLLPKNAVHDMSGRVQQQADELLKKVLRDRPAVLHTTTDFTNALAVRAVANAVGIPWVYEVRGQLADTWLSSRPESARNSEKYQLFMEREAAVAQQADHVFTLGHTMKVNLVQAGVDDHKVSIVPNGIGDKFLDQPVERLEARERLGLDPEAFYVGSVSSVVPYEGFSTAVKTVARLAPEFPNLRLLIVGDGTDRENLLQLAKSLGIADRCEFPGRVPRELAHLYHASLNVFVVPRVDSMVTRSVTPLKPVEAMASEVPVVASDLPALRELVVEGDNGHLVPPGDISGWAGAIRGLIVRPAEAERMGKSGREFVLASRTWGQNANSIGQVYDQVINQASGK